MKKIFALVFAPLLSLLIFFGCTAPKYTVVDVKLQYASFIDKYIDDDVNEMFKFNIYPHTSDQDEGIFNESEQNAFTLEKIMYLTYDDTYGLNTKINDIYTSEQLEDPLTAQMHQVKTIYQSLLSLIYNYYANWSHSFYLNIAETDITQEEINSLYDNIKTLKSATDDLLERKHNLERIVKMDGIDSTRLIAEFNTLNYKFNKVIERSLNFVNNFKSLHKKYLMTADEITPFYAERLVDEVLLQIAEAVYYDNVKAFEKNNSVKLYELLTLFSGSNPYNLVSNTSGKWLNGLTYEYNETALIANSNINALLSDGETTVDEALSTDSNPTLKDEAENLISQLKIQSNSFAQNLKVYKSIFNKVNLSDYNYLRGLAVPPATFDAESLSALEKANINILKSFGTDNLAGLIDILFTVVNI